MRRKRSRDTRLVEKFSKKKEEQVTESRLLHAHLPVVPSNPTTAETLGVEGSEEEDELLQVHNRSQTNLQVHVHLLWYACSPAPLGLGLDQSQRWI